MANVRRGQVLDYNNNPVACRSWLVPEWNAYKIRFKRAVEHAWNNQLILLPTESGDPNDALSDADYRQLISNPNVRAHVEGAIDIELMPINAAGHALIEVVHLDNAGATSASGCTGSRTSRSSSEALSRRNWPGWTTGQITAAHEVGHWLRGSTPPISTMSMRSMPRRCRPRSGPRRSTAARWAQGSLR